MSDLDYKAFMEKDAAEQKWLSSRPVCGWCGEPIQEEAALYFDNEWMCDDCVKAYRRMIPDEDGD